MLATPFGIPIVVMLGSATPLIPIYSFAERTTNWFATISSKGIKNIKECPRAEAAEKQGRFTDAENFYKEEISGKDEEDYMINIKLGNLYIKQKKNKVAAECWKKALRKELTPEMYITTTMRLSDLLRHKLNKQQEADEILKEAIKLHPDRPETKSLKNRLSEN
ncbi:MAG: tetratricopeptide repeat protein [Planctomycetota bacterium]|jgi:tetratricopeptide (TPR) repeat protein